MPTSQTTKRPRGGPGPAAKRPRSAPWSDEACERFVAGAGRPSIASASSARPHRDIKGWIVSLLREEHAPRWRRLADDAAAAEVAEREAASSTGYPVLYPGIGASYALPVTGAADVRGAKQADVATLLARGIMERVIVQQEGESKRIATSNARRQSAREVGRLTLVRLVDVAIAIRACELCGGGAFESASAFRRLSGAVRALRAVDELDEASEAVERYVNSPAWWEAYGGHVMREAVLRASKHAKDGDLIVAPVPCEHPIFSAALLADCDKRRAIELADKCCNLDGMLVAKFRRGDGPLPLKQMRQVLYCEAALMALHFMKDLWPEKGTVLLSTEKVMEKLHTLFVPRDWHMNTSECRKSLVEVLEFLESRHPKNLAARSIRGDWLAKEGSKGEAKKMLEDASAAGDVMAPITLARLEPASATVKKNELLWTSVERGSSLAALTLGKMHEDAQSAQHADQCYQLSITRGSSMAALKLAKMYHYGLGGAKRDQVLATRFYSIAKDRGEQEYEDVYALAVVGLARLKIRTQVDDDGVVGKEPTESARSFCLGVFEVYGKKVDGHDLREMVSVGIFGMESRHSDGLENPSASDAIRAIEVAMWELEETQRIGLAEAFGSAVVLLAQTRGESDRSTAQAWESLFGLVAEVESTSITDKQQALFYLGCLKRSEGDEASACSFFQRSAEAGHGKAPNNAGIYLMSCERFNEALEFFALGAGRCDASAACNAAYVSIKKLNRFQEGIEWFERAVELGSASAPANLAKTLIENAEAKDSTPEFERLQGLLDLSIARGFSDDAVLDSVRVAVGK